MLKRIFIWLVILGTAAGSLYGFEMTRLPCRTALTYTLGAFDERFGITRDDFQLAIAEAEKPWEAALGRELFQFDAGATFPVNLIFDERQARTLESQNLGQVLATVQSKQESIKEVYARLVRELRVARQEYDATFATFEVRLKQYNARVAKWNASDRMDEDEIDWLQNEARKLEREQKTLESKRQRVNGLVAEVNQYAKEEEKIIDRYNAKLNEFTETYGTGEVFDQGIYNGEGIDIFQFDSRDHLYMVLVHELGHALGLGHVDNPKSIMYPMMGEQDVKHLQLSTEDRSAFTEVCLVSAWDLLFRDLRKVGELISV